jgi:tol-pal system beta propeller repeat protein TolB
VRLTSYASEEGAPAWSSRAPQPLINVTGIVATRWLGGTNPEIMLMSPTGDAAGVINLSNDPVAYDLEPEASPDGKWIAWRKSNSGVNDIWLMRIDGTDQRRLFSCGYSSDPSWSPDGQRITFHSNCGGNDDIWVMNADGSSPTRITTDPASDGTPSWSPDGIRIAFASNRTGTNEIFTVRYDGTDEQRISFNSTLDYWPTWSPNAREIAHTCGSNICITNVQTKVTRNLTTDGADNDHPAWSPDGLTIAFISPRGNTAANLWMMNADGTGPATRLTTSTVTDQAPAWVVDNSIGGISPFQTTVRFRAIGAPAAKSPIPSKPKP